MTVDRGKLKDYEYKERRAIECQSHKEGTQNNGKS